jgi:predicted transposase YdaD
MDKKRQSTSPVDKPHDKLIRRLLSNPASAHELLDAYLPEEVKDLLDLSFLERQPDTFVDSQHRILEVDVLFKTRCKLTLEDSYVWLLIEQQRNPDVWLPLRKFCYIGIIWDHIRKSAQNSTANNKLPFIYPLIISNSSKPYKYSLNLRDMIEPEAAKPLFDKLFTQPIQLIDLAVIPDQELRTKLQKHVSAQALLLSLKHVFDQNLQDTLENILLSLFQQMEKIGYIDEVADMLYYLYNEGNLNNSSQFWMFLHTKFSSNVEEKVMSLGQQAIQQAVQQAVQKAVQQAVHDTEQQNSEKIALQLLKKKIDINIIAQSTNLSTQKLLKLATVNGINQC